MKKTKNLSKILVLLLSLALIVGAMVMVVSASDDIGYDLTASLNDAQDGKVTLTGNAYVNGYDVTKDLEINLNGYTLTSTAAAAFTVNADVTFTITGDGKINLNGMLISSTSTTATPTVNVVGATYGIDINHTGSADKRIAIADAGNWLFKNLDVVSTYAGNPTGDAGALFGMTQSKTARGAVMTFDDLYLIADDIVSRNPGMGAFEVTGQGKLVIKNSYVHTGATGILAGFSAMQSDDAVFISIENSHLENFSKGVNGAGYRGYAIAFWKSGEAETAADVRGVVNVEGSVVQASYRVFVSGHTQKSEGGNDIYINCHDSIIQCLNNNSTESGADIGRGRKVKITITGDSIFGFKYAANGSTLTIGDGVRSSYSTKPSSFVNDGTYAWIYDPIGNKDYPYIAVRIKDAAGNPIEGALTANTVATGDFFFRTGFEDLASTLSAGTYDGAFQVDESSIKWRGEITGYYEGASRTGTLTEKEVNGDSFLKYWVSPVNANYKHKAALDAAGYDGTVTRNFDAEKAIHGGTNDNYFILGGKSYNSSTDYNNIMYNPVSLANRATVVVYDVDIATDSLHGFPQLSISITTRGTAGGNNSDTVSISVSPSGAIGFTGSSGANAPTQLNMNGEWNHVTAVCYTDPGEAKGRVYYYINGEYLGHTTLYKSTASYIEGLRVSISNGSTHTVGSSILWDNFSFRSYKSYINSNEADGTVVDGVYTAGTHTPEAYLIDALTAHKQTNAIAPFEAGGKFFSDINDAAAYANELGIAVDLRSSDYLPQKVTSNIIVNTNGFDLNITDDSYGADIKYDNAGNVVRYVFDESYNDLIVNYYWYFDGLNEANRVNDDYFHKTELKVGQTPEFDLVNNDIVDLSLNTARKQIGWATEGNAPEEFSPVTISQAVAQGSEPVRVYPVYSDPYEIVSYVMNDGKAIIGNANDAATTAAYAALTDGDTLVLLADWELDVANTVFNFSERDSIHGVTIDQDYTADELAQMKAAAAVIGIDLNGYTLNFDIAGTVCYVGDNAMVNVYSSREGGLVVSRAIKSATAFYAQRMFGSYNGVYGANQEVHNSHINLGAYGDIPGSNLTVNGGVILEGLNGDDSCSMLSDGATLVRSIADSTGAIMTRWYDGEITIKDGILFVESGNAIDMKTYYKSFDNTTKDYAKDADGNYIRTSDAGPRVYTPYVKLDGCAVIGNGSSNLIMNNGDAKQTSIELVNVTTNFRVNPCNYNRTIIGEGVTMRVNDVGKYTSGVKYYLYNAPVKVGESDLLSFAIPTIVEGSIVDTTYYVANYGVSLPEGARGVVLPLFDKMTAKAADTVTVTFEGLGENDDVTNTYVKGGNVKSITASAYTGTALKLTHDGTWSSLPTNVQEDVTLTPGYTVSASVSGVLANVSLYSDFHINLYIPAKYAEFITDINGVTELSTVTVNGAEYIKATVEVGCDQATDAAEFVINLSELGETGAVTASVSLAAYAGTILEGESYSAADKKLMYYMVNYANEAYKYFGENTEDNAELAALLDAYKENNEVAEADRSFAKAIENMNISAVISKATLNLASAPEFVLILKDGFAGTVTVTYGANVKTFEVEAEDSRNLVIDGMKAYNFGTRLDITAEGTIGEESVEVTAGSVNLDTFAKYHVNNAEDAESETKADSEACLALLLAFYDYVEASEEYKELKDGAYNAN